MTRLRTMEDAVRLSTFAHALRMLCLARTPKKGNEWHLSSVRLFLQPPLYLRGSFKNGDLPLARVLDGVRGDVRGPGRDAAARFPPQEWRDAPYPDARRGHRSRPPCSDRM